LRGFRLEVFAFREAIFIFVQIMFVGETRWFGVNLNHVGADLREQVEGGSLPDCGMPLWCVGQSFMIVYSSITKKKHERFARISPRYEVCPKSQKKEMIGY